MKCKTGELGMIYARRRSFQAQTSARKFGLVRKNRTRFLFSTLPQLPKLLSGGSEMTSTKWRVIVSIALIVVFSGLLVPAQVNLAGPAANQAAPLASKAGVPLLGKVMTSGGKSILIDGNSVSAGTTVFSGSFVRTLDSVSATILLGPLGKLDVAPKTSFRIFFDPRKIEVELEQGCVILTTNAGIRGTIRTAAGATENIGPEKQAVLDICTGESPAVPPTVGQEAAAKAGAGVVDQRVVGAAVSPLLFAIGSGAFVTAATTYTLTADTRPVPASPSVP